jgi:hypothetical protein
MKNFITKLFKKQRVQDTTVDTAQIEGHWEGSKRIHYKK